MVQDSHDFNHLVFDINAERNLCVCLLQKYQFHGNPGEMLPSYLVLFLYIHCHNVLKQHLEMYLEMNSTEYYYCYFFSLSGNKDYKTKHEFSIVAK